MRGLVRDLRSPHPMGEALPSIYAHEDVGTGEPSDDTRFPAGRYLVDLGERSDAEGATAADRWVISMTPDTEDGYGRLGISFHRAGRRVATGHVVPRPTTLEIVSSQCGTAVGRYGWTFDGSHLTLVVEDDPCDARAELLTAAPLERRPLAMRIMDAFDETLAPVLATLDNLEAYFDPRLAPDDFVDWLCTWVSFSPRQDAPLGQRRDHVRLAVELLRQWGTADAIKRYIAIFAGLDPADVEIEDNGGVTSSTDPRVPLPGRPEPSLTVRVRHADDVDPRHLDRLVRAAKPAHMPHVVEVVSG